MMRKPSCLISCSHWLPDGSLSVLVGRHGAMNPARSVRIRNIMPIVRDYSRASQCFLFARLTRARHDFICRTLGSADKWEGTMKTRHTVVLLIIAGAALSAVVDFVSGSVVAQPMRALRTRPP